MVMLTSVQSLTGLQVVISTRTEALHSSNNDGMTLPQGTLAFNALISQEPCAQTPCSQLLLCLTTVLGKVTLLGKLAA
jgi:hypothetical protein